MFKDREDAGRKLAEALKTHAEEGNTVVIALPRGGVVLGRIIADGLGAHLDIVVPRKIGAEGHEEYAIGAITEKGDAIWNETERMMASQEYLDQKMAEEKAEAKRRLDHYRKGRSLRDLKGKTVIVVDDGIATGLTMKAALKTVRSERPKRVIVAVPVAPPDSVKEIEALADETVVLQTPLLFMAIGGFYKKFDQVDDETVIELMKE